MTELIELLVTNNITPEDDMWLLSVHLLGERVCLSSECSTAYKAIMGRHIC